MNVCFFQQSFHISKYLSFHTFHYFYQEFEDVAYFSIFLSVSELRSESCFLDYCSSSQKKKKQNTHDFFRSINISNNSFFYVDVRFFAIIFVFFLRRNVVTRILDSLFVLLETSFFLKLSETEKKNEILILVCCSS